MIDVAAGGMHTAFVDSHHHVHTFGCNDEGALGRPSCKPATVMAVGGRVATMLGCQVLEPGQVAFTTTAPAALHACSCSIFHPCNSLPLPSHWTACMHAADDGEYLADEAHGLDGINIVKVRHA